MWSLLQIPNFNSTIVKFMLDFLARTVFQHYSLYSQVYQLPEREEDLVKVTLEVETARIPPLSRGELQLVEPEEQDQEALAQILKSIPQQAESVMRIVVDNKSRS